MAYRLNQRIAGRLRRMGELLEHQGASSFRSGAYHRAADVAEGLARSLGDVLAEEGREGLIALPAIGVGIASAIAEMVTTGRWSALENLTGQLDPEALLATVPGIGPQTAQLLHRHHGIDTLEELERATLDGRLDGVPQLGARRLDAIRASVHERLQAIHGRRRERRTPKVGVLLGIDADYRRKADANQLKLIAPRRFNPRRLAWLPVMHVHSGKWHFTALFSNTARAHQLGKTRDWVLIFVSHDRDPDWQCTVVTETRGPLKGKRVVRGMEAECEAHYAAVTA